MVKFNPSNFLFTAFAQVILEVITDFGSFIIEVLDHNEFGI